jgi:hypothetical protein
VNYRLYYHRTENAPQVWSVDSGNQGSEIHVQWVILGKGVEATTVFDVNAPLGAPKGWLEVSGAILSVRDGTAYLEVPPVQ